MGFPLYILPMTCGHPTQLPRRLVQAMLVLGKIPVGVKTVQTPTPMIVRTIRGPLAPGSLTLLGMIMLRETSVLLPKMVTAITGGVPLWAGPQKLRSMSNLSCSGWTVSPTHPQVVAETGLMSTKPWQKLTDTEALNLLSPETEQAIDVGL